MWFHLFTAVSMLCDIHAVYMDIMQGPWETIHTQVSEDIAIKEQLYGQQYAVANATGH